MPQPRKTSSTTVLEVAPLIYGLVRLEYTPRLKPVATYRLQSEYYSRWNGNIQFFSEISISTYVFVRIYSVAMLL
jgi:hypothetical protein